MFAALSNDIVQRIREGDTDAFEHLYRSYFPVLSVYAAGITKSPELARDVVQDLFAKLWRLRASWNVSGNLESYLYVATRNAARDALRAQELADVRAGIYTSELALNNEGPPTDADILAMERAKAIHAAISTLPDRARETFLLSREQGLTYTEIAAKLGISVKTVEMHLTRALKALRATLGETAG